MKKHFSYFFISMLCIITSVVFLSTACSKQKSGSLSIESPTNITVWNYYSGTLAIAFDELISEFNNTVGRENRVEVHSESMSTNASLENALWDAATGKVGAAQMPNIFQCYQDTALALDEVVSLVDFDNYITEEEKISYVGLFLDSGYIGENQEWKIFPIAKSTEVLILNKTDWNRFAADTGAEIQDLSTWEGLAETAEKYYEWSGGRAFFGRDAFANYLITASSQLGHEIFESTGNAVKLDFDKDTMRRIWDNYYAPYVKGYYKHVGNYRCDDVKLGEIIALVCSSSSAVFFPSEVTLPDGSSYPIESMVLPLPNFDRTAPYATQQGAGMAVVQSTDAEVQASILFLKWFTEKEQNLRFSVNSGYMPVSVEAIKPESIDSYLLEHPASDIVRDTLFVSLDENNQYAMYTAPAFVGGAQARNILETTMLELAVNDRAAVEAGMPADEFLTDEHFEEWYNDTLSKLQECCR